MPIVIPPGDFDKTAIKIVERQTKAFALDLAKTLRSALARANPIDTGRSSASWNLQATRPDLSQKPPDYYNPGGAPEDGNINVKHFRIGGSLYITNTIPYLKYLNAGHSRQAPAGFIEAVIQRVIRQFRRKKKGSLTSVEVSVEE